MSTYTEADLRRYGFYYDYIGPNLVAKFFLLKDAWETQSSEQLFSCKEEFKKELRYYLGDTIDEIEYNRVINEFVNSNKGFNKTIIDREQKLKDRYKTTKNLTQIIVAILYGHYQKKP